MTNKTEFVNGRYGLRAIVKSAWSKELTAELLSREIVELELNHAKGWYGEDLQFLSSFAHLKAFEIFDFRISSDEPMHFLHELRALHVSTYCETELNFSAFPHLEDCSLEWRKKAGSLFGCTTLKKLFLNSYKGKNLDELAPLSHLESLAILSAPIENVKALKNMVLLRHLRLANLRRLISLDGIQWLKDLEELDINTCRSIGSLEEIGHLTNLKKLYLNNCDKIASLKPLDKLDRLEQVLFYESTDIVDGDLWPLARLKNLSNVTFKNRKHYTHRREDFGAAYFERPNVSTR